jgi:hypothetical protein
LKDIKRVAGDADFTFFLLVFFFSSSLFSVDNKKEQNRKKPTKSISFLLFVCQYTTSFSAQNKNLHLFIVVLNAVNLIPTHLLDLFHKSDYFLIQLHFATFIL